MNSDKAELRGQIRCEISQLDEDYIKSSNGEITKRLLSMFEYKQTSRIFSYYSVARECDTRQLISLALCEGRTVALPRVHGHGKMSFAEFSRDLIRGPLNIPEPSADAAELIPDEQDIIVVPALCCDETLQRLGQGGGYYDRYMPKINALKICFCREKLLLKKLPITWNDFPVDIVITELRVIRAK